MGKVALVTGGERGIGRAIALELARQGADVAIAGVPGELPHVHYPQGTPEDLARTVADIEAMGRRAHGMRLDVRDEAQVERVVIEPLDVLGGLDVAVNNAAVNTPATPLAEFDAGAFDVIMDVNLRGA